ncbi:MAG TPA: DUF5985 family protein [Steroidobacteraceae bacterium]|nr:DUF5985 family protein [Steroidobacteraceae bacterium]
MIAAIIYCACGLTSGGCAWLLARGYRASGTRLLFWAALCFVGLTIDNIVLFIDLVLAPSLDLFYWRTIPAAAGLIVMIYGLIWESR